MITDLPYPPMHVPDAPLSPAMVLSVALLGLIAVVPLWMLAYMLVHESRAGRAVITLGLGIWPRALWRWFANLFVGPPVSYRPRHSNRPTFWAPAESQSWPEAA